MLSTAVKSTKYGGAVTCCRNVASAKLDLTVYSFILRGVRLIGSDSVQCKRRLWEDLWQKIASDWKLDNLANFIVVKKEDIEEELNGI